MAGRLGRGVPERPAITVNGREIVTRRRMPGALRALRAGQWTKNVFVLAALVFAQLLNDLEAVLTALGAFAVFCVLSSAVYVLNDLADREADRRHPVKRFRPIAAGELTVGAASVLAVVLAAAGLAGAWYLGASFASVACSYLLMNLAYSLVLKRVVILDVMLVAAGFLLRAWAGAVVLNVAMSHWLVLCTGLLALFLGFVKRRQELVVAQGSTETRPILREYSLPFLDQMIAVVTASTVLSYTLYAFSTEVAEKLGTRYMGLTIPFVLFGIFRYLYLVHHKGQGESPSGLVVTDVPLLADILLWGASVIVALYALP
jgi:4-hydroxybenzoate polyprenyltransferase